MDGELQEVNSDVRDICYQVKHKVVEKISRNFQQFHPYIYKSYKIKENNVGIGTNYKIWVDCGEVKVKIEVFQPLPSTTSQPVLIHAKVDEDFGVNDGSRNRSDFNIGSN